MLEAGTAGRSVRVLLVAACAACASIALADSARVHVSARILPRVDYAILHHPETFAVTMDDVRRGFVDLRAAVRLDIRTNCAYLVALEVTSPTVASAHATMLGQPIGPGGTPFPAVLGVRPVALDFRFILAAHTSPGVHPWPSRLVVQPVD